MSPTFVIFLNEHWDEILLVGLCVTLVVFASIKTIEAASLRADLAESRQAMSDLSAEASRTAQALTEQLIKNQVAHARGQAEQEHAYAEERQRQAAARTADRRELDRLRNAIQTYAASGGATGGVDAAAGVGQDDRLVRLAGLLEEGVGLALEGRGVVERRDAEVKRLLDQIALDRSACSVTPQTDPPQP